MLISIHADVKKLTRQLTGLARDQIPFAVAQTVNGVAKRAIEAEQAAMTAQLDRPTPFTLRGIGLMRATKAMPIATLFIKDIQARYLRPEIAGGLQVLGNNHAILRPVDQPLNQYGNIPKGAIARLKGRSNIFIGTIVTPRGQRIGGVWEKVNVTRKGGARRTPQRGMIFTKQHGALRLLTRYRWGDAVRRTVNAATTASEFNAALTRALATAK
jgi:hypothetical protein